MGGVSELRGLVSELMGVVSELPGVVGELTGAHQAGDQLTECSFAKRVN